MTEERKDAIGLPAEKVMKFPGMKDVTRDFLFSTWNPFERPADAVALVEALPGGHEGIGIEIHYERETHCRAAWMRWSGGKESPAEICETFSEAVSMAVYVLVVERPQLFAEAK